MLNPLELSQALNKIFEGVNMITDDCVIPGLPLPPLRLASKDPKWMTVTFTETGVDLQFTPIQEIEWLSAGKLAEAFLNYYISENAIPDRTLRIARDGAQASFSLTAAECQLLYKVNITNLLQKGYTDAPPTYDGPQGASRSSNHWWSCFACCSCCCGQDDDDQKPLLTAKK